MGENRRSKLFAGGVALFAAASLALSGCAGKGAQTSTQSGAASGEVTLITHNDFKLPEDLIKEFQNKSGLKLKIVNSGSGAELVSKLALTKTAPIGDVVYGIATNDMGRLAKEDLVTDAKVGLPKGVSAYGDKATPQAVPIDRGDVCINVDTTYFAAKSLPIPETFEDLLKPEYKGLTVTMKASKVTGFAIVAATVAHFGEGKWQDYWKSLKGNGLKIVDGWSEAYNQEFTQGEGKGKYPIVVSYASSPAYTVNEQKNASTTKALKNTCYQQVEYAALLANAKNPEGGAKVIEWLLSTRVQEAIPENMYMYPVNEEVRVPAEFEKFGPQPVRSLLLDSNEVAKNHEKWVKEWTSAVS